MAEVKAPALSPALIQQAEFKRNIWSVTVPPGISLGSVLAPEFWAHCAKSLKAYDRLECRAQDNSWYADLMVRKVEQTAVHMWALNYADLNAQAATAESVGEFVVSFAPKQKWRVVRASDKEVIHQGEANKADAEAWLADHLKTTA
jgi:hypothetical protein